ncbi:hypothetical protein O181_131056 [Austropuccinia psidii MF-1]|uniref:Uncharacterized protein n=1 Tax=Austropuccinia psidii MF-1 TaxID=1389203 RepID=A0A9Q3L3X4_9BASI|nr:hypothetical protein [Austropuccinia psidii MF-1]
MAETYIPIETQSQANTPVTTSEPEGRKGKGKRHSEGLVTATKWKPIATQRNRKPQNSASIKGKPTLTTCTGKITIINPVVTCKRKLPKSADTKFVQGTVKGKHPNNINLLNSCKHVYVPRTPQKPCLPKEPTRGKRRLVKNQMTWKRTPWT